MSRKKPNQKPKLPDNPNIYTPIPPSRMIPGVTSVPIPPRVAWFRLAYYDPEGPPDEIEYWIGEPIRNDERGRQTLREYLDAFDHRMLSDYDLPAWVAVLPWFDDRSEARQLYRVRPDDDDGGSGKDAPSPSRDSGGKKTA